MPEENMSSPIGRSRGRIASWVILWIALTGFLACIDRRQDDYHFGEVLTPEKMQSLIPRALEGLDKLGAEDFKVVQAEPTEGFELNIMDGFLYSRNFEILHLEIELELLRPLKPLKMGQVVNGIGKEGWSMEETARNRQLALLFGDAANSRNRPEQKNEFQEELGKVAVELFGKAGQISSHGSPSKSFSDPREAPWRIIIRFGFPAARNHLFSLFPQPAGNPAWASVGNFSLQYWREKEGRFSSQADEDYLAQGGVVAPELSKLKENFLLTMNGDEPDGPGARFRRLLNQYLGSGDQEAIAAGTRWKTVATVVFNRTEGGSSLQHVGGYWKLHLPKKSEGAR